MGLFAKVKQAAKSVGGNVKDKIIDTKEKVQASNIGAKIKDKVGDAIDFAKSVGSPWLLLLPVRPQMIAALKIKGIKPPSEMEALAESFYNNVVKQSGFDNSVDNNPDGFAHFSEVSREKNNFIPPEAVSVIVSAIITFIKGIKEKKEAGKALSKVEKAVDEVSTTAENAAYEGAMDEAQQQVGEQVIKWLPYVLGAIVLLFVLKKFKVF